VLTLAQISKSFPGVRALDSVHLEVGAGEVVALVGENGAGKSTLVKILAGIHQPDSGAIRIHGESVQLRSPRDAACRGIGIIHQELELIDTLDVASNIFLGREYTRGGRVRILHDKRMRDEATRILQRLRAPLSPRIVVAKLSPAQRQMVEIARALSLDPKILLMDEPTSSLTAVETDHLLEIVKELRERGVSVIYVSHRLSEVKAIADRVCVLRDGRNAGTLRSDDITHDRMIQLMVGRDLNQSNCVDAPAESHAVFEIRNIRTRRYPDAAVSITVRGGEILGLAGLVGAGRTELAHAIFAVEPRLAGDITKDGKPLKILSPRDAIGGGIYLVPEDRRTLGLITEWTVRENVTLPALGRFSRSGLIQRQPEREGAVRMCDALRIKTPSVETIAANLSGGNQQKTVLAKWLSLDPKLILFDEPTRGIDVGSKAEIYALMRRLAGEGVALVLISSDMEELLGNSHRIAVMHDGRITGVLDRSECSQENIMRLAVA
jgi:ribose transport system ATP-binding protein